MRWLRYFILLSAFTLFSSVANAGEDPIGWSLKGSIPDKTILNETYPAITYTIINNMPFMMPTELFVGKEVKGQFVLTDNCTGVKLKPKQTCTVDVATFAPTNRGTHSIELTLEYGRNVVHLPVLSTVAKPRTPLVTGLVPTPLPANIGTGAPTPVVFEFINQGNGTVNGVSYVPNYPPQFTEITNTCTSVTTLGPGASCTVTGNLLVMEPGPYTVAATLNYTGGSTTVSTSTVAGLQVVGTTTVALPLDSATGAIYPFQFTFTNTGTEFVDGVNMPTVTVNGGMLVGTIATTCTGSVLPAKESCTVSGNYESTSPGMYTVTGTFSYNGGVVSASTTTTSSVMVTPAVVTGLPANLGTGATYPFEFSFTNNSTAPAANVTAATATVTTGSGVITGFSTNCPIGSSLAAGATCTVSGNFETDNPGTQTITGSFSYDGGTVQISTSGNASVMVVVSAVNGLPPNMATGSIYPFSFSFTNDGAVTANNITVATAAVTMGSGTITNLATTCGTSLAAGATCTISGNFEADNPGLQTITATFTYDGGTLSPSTSSTASMMVSGLPTTPLPNPFGTGSTYPFVFTFTNSATVPANNITGVTATVTAGSGVISGLSSDCGTSLGAGATCTLSGSFQANNPGLSTITASFTYDGGTVTTSTSGTGAIQVVGVPSTPLPPMTGTGSTYPFVFTYTNNATETANNITVATAAVTSGSGVLSDVATTCVTSLAAAATCTISGNFQADNQDTEVITATFTYDGGTVTSTTTTMASIMVAGVPTTPLPTMMVAGTSYPFVFTFTNNATETANGINPTPTAAITSGTGTLTAVSTTCGTSLAAATTCTVSGNVVATAASPPNLTVTAYFIYDGGTVSPTTSGSVRQLISVTVNPGLPTSIGTGTIYSIVYTYRNIDSNPATGIITPTAEVTSGTGTLTNVATTCGATLASNATCTLSMNFETLNTDTEAVTATFTYDGGTIMTVTPTPPNVGMSSLLLTAVPTNQASTPLPAAMGTGSTYPFAFTFKNPTSGIANNITASTATVLEGNGTISDLITTCGTDLTAFATCTVTGNYTTGSTPGPQAVQGMFTFDGGTVAPITQGNATMLVMGAVTTGFPTSVTAGDVYNLEFTFTNGGTVSANGPFTATVTSALGTFALTSDLCSGRSQLGPMQSCTVSGMFTAADGANSASATLSYAGGTTAPATTSANSAPSMQVTGVVTSGFPTTGMTAGNVYNLEFTFTNGGTTTANGPLTATVTQAGGTYAMSSDQCTGLAQLGPAQSCTVSGTFTAAEGANSASATVTYTGGTTEPATTSGNAVPSIVSGIATMPLPNPAPLNTASNFTITFSNTSSTVNASGVNVVYTYGGTGPQTDFSAVSNNCGSTLDAGNSCTVTGTLTPSVASATYTFTATFNFTGGAAPAVTLSTTAASMITRTVTGSVTKPLPPLMGTGEPSAFKLLLVNHGRKKVENISASIVAKPAATLTLDKETSACGTAIKSLPPGGSCTVSGLFTAPVTGDYALDVDFSYDGKSLPLNMQTNAGRVFTLNNHCPSNVWFAFNGIEVKKGCKTDQACPAGSVCAVDADGGKGICYWANPQSESHDWKLPAGGSTKVIVPDRNKEAALLWQGLLAGRTGCEGAACETADCLGTGGKACVPGAAFANPATTARIKLLRYEADTYSIETLNGVNLGIAIGPAKGGDCTTPGSACSWKFAPPSADFIWVKAAIGKPAACNSNLDCSTTGEVCGLSYTTNQKPSFQRICGQQLGYWTAQQACALNAAEAEAWFGCYDSLLNTACTSVNGSRHCLNDDANMLTWLKNGCSAAVTYTGEQSEYHCNTIAAGTNVTNYNVTFCPV